MNSVLPIPKMRIVAAAIFIAAIGLFFWRPATLALPAPPANYPQDNITDNEQKLSLAQATTSFDLSVLPPKPAPIAKEQPVDPTAAIRRHQLVGVTINKAGAFALVSDGARTFILKHGDMLDGFVVNKIQPRRVEFRKGDVIAALELPETVQ